MPKKGYKWSDREKKKRSDGMKRAYRNDKTLRERTKHVGKDNGRYIDGRTMQIKYCIDCKKRISWRAIRCRKCALEINRKKSSFFRGEKHSEKTKRIIGKKSKAKFTKKYKKRQRKVFEEKGYWIPLNKKEPYSLYCKESNWQESMINYLNRKELKLLNKRGIFSSENPKGMVRDHKYSRCSGFKNEVFPIILRHPANCQLITHAENLSKAHSNNRYKDSNSISLKQLFKLIKKYKKKWTEQKLCLKKIKKYQEGDRYVVVGGGLK